MKLKFAVCDDRKEDISYIVPMVQNWADENRILIEVDSFPSAEAFLFHYADDKTYDILLLDIEMGKMDGVTMAKTVRKENKTVQIVFITGYSDYIAEGYDVAALHYLMKPVKEEKLWEVLDRAKEKIMQNEKALTLFWAGETARIPMHEIYYISVEKNYVTVHGAKDYTVKTTLGEFAEKLDDRFVKTGRAMIVNLDYITKVTRTEVHLMNGEKLPLPKGAYDAVNRAIIKHT